MRGATRRVPAWLCSIEKDFRLLYSASKFLDGEQFHLIVNRIQAQS
jgi:hypothetical protein